MGGRGAPVCQPLRAGLYCLGPQCDGDAVPPRGKEQPGGAEHRGCGGTRGARFEDERRELGKSCSGKSRSAEAALGCRENPGMQGEPGVQGKHPRARGSLFLLPRRAEMGAQGTPTPRRQPVPLSFPGRARVPPVAGAAPSPARRAQFRRRLSCCPKAQLCWSSPRAGCAPSRAGWALPPTPGITPGPRGGGVGLGGATMPCPALPSCAGGFSPPCRLPHSAACLGLFQPLLLHAAPSRAQAWGQASARHPGCPCPPLWGCCSWGS